MSPYSNSKKTIGFMFRLFQALQIIIKCTRFYLYVDGEFIGSKDRGLSNRSGQVEQQF